jgi:tRNA pseudouridine38-40 synthase
MPPVHRYRLTIAYLGTNFVGWQRQARGPTIQGTLEDVLAGLNGGPVKTLAAGRTDAGVHAAAQVAHADLDISIPGANLTKVLNDRLPDAIRILEAKPVPTTFHAIAHAASKRYVYRAHFDGDAHPPWVIARSAGIRPPDDAAVLDDLVARLPGRRDWRAFTVTEPTTRTTVRTVLAADLEVGTRSLRFEISGEGFLRYQVRRIVGGLMQVSWGHHAPEWFVACLDDPPADPQLHTAPARGLTLEDVTYRDAPSDQPGPC